MTWRSTVAEVGIAGAGAKFDRLVPGFSRAVQGWGLCENDVGMGQNPGT